MSEPSLSLDVCAEDAPGAFTGGSLMVRSSLVKDASLDPPERDRLEALLRTRMSRSAC